MVFRFFQLMIGPLAVFSAALAIVPAAEAQIKKSSIATVMKSPVAKRSSAKTELLAALGRSKTQAAISRMIEISVQGKRIDSRFDHLKPGRFRLFESGVGIDVREAVEVDQQRFQKSKGQWVKVRKDPYPLREQFFDLFFPTQLVSKPTDIFKIKSSPVTSLGVEEKDGKKFLKYRYDISYSDTSCYDTGIVWINDATGLIELVETEGVGLAGKFTAVWKYDYATSVTIDTPESFVEKDWIN